MASVVNYLYFMAIGDQHVAIYASRVNWCTCYSNCFCTTQIVYYRKSNQMPTVTLPNRITDCHESWFQSNHDLNWTTIWFWQPLQYYSSTHNNDLHGHDNVEM